jgi:uncharacterized membrane protein
MSEPDSPAPWYVRTMLGAAGCLAALFLLGFVVVGLEFVVKSRTASMIAGVIMIGGAYVLLRASRGDFSAMFSFALSLVGQALLGYGIFSELRGERTAPWAAMTIVEVILAAAMPNFIHRFAAVYLAGFMFGMALGVIGAGGLTAGLLAAATAWVWLSAQRPGAAEGALVPIGYGAALALVNAESATSWEQALVGFTSSYGARDLLRAWTGEALALAAFLFVIGMLLRQAGWRLSDRRALIALAVAAAAGAASFKAPGIASGLMIVLLGFASGRRVLLGLGIVALLFYVSSYYYQLNTTLLVKSGVLAATGVVLLAARWLMLRVVLPAEGRDA